VHELECCPWPGPRCVRHPTPPKTPAPRATRRTKATEESGWN
jgi:hypothetical protein